MWAQEARKHGQRPHQVARWIRRKAGTTVCIWRQLRDGSLGVSVPCICCRQLLTQLDLRVCCVVEGGKWWGGRLDSPEAPASKPTSGQRRVLRFQADRGGAASSAASSGGSHSGSSSSSGSGDESSGAEAGRQGRRAAAGGAAAGATAGGRERAVQRLGCGGSQRPGSCRERPKRPKAGPAARAPEPA
jgi:hypothetical protein